MNTDDWVSSTIQSSTNQQTPRRRKKPLSRQHAVSRHRDSDSRKFSAQDVGRSLAVPDTGQKSTDFRLAPLSSSNRVPLTTRLPSPPHLTLPPINQEKTSFYLIQTPQLSSGVNFPEEAEKKAQNIEASASQGAPRRRNSSQLPEKDLLLFNPEEFFPARDGTDDPSYSQSHRKRGSLESNSSNRDRGVRDIVSDGGDQKVKSNDNIKHKTGKPKRLRKAKSIEKNSENKNSSMHVIDKTINNSSNTKDSNDDLNPPTAINTNGGSVYKEASTKHQNIPSNPSTNLESQLPHDQTRTTSNTSSRQERKRPIPHDALSQNRPEVLVANYDLLVSPNVPEILTASEVMNRSGPSREGDGVRNDIMSEGETKIKIHLSENEKTQVKSERGFNIPEILKDEDVNERRKRLAKEDPKYVEGEYIIMLTEHSM